MIPINPLFTIEVKDLSIGLEGYVCIHSIGPNGSSGGMRCVDDITKNEVELLAKAMTFKYSFFGIQQGGAKAGLRLPYNATSFERQRLVSAMAKHLEPLVKRSSIWSVWTDMNFYKEDLNNFYKSIGITTNYGGTSGSTFRTGVTCAWTVDSVAESFCMNPQDVRVAFEGYGGVAQVAAQLMAEKGYKIVALSNHLGSVYCKKGIDLKEVNSIKERIGHEWIMSPNGSWDSVSKDNLFEVPCDILVPGARVHSIDSKTANVINARAVVPVANVPCTEEALEVIEYRGMLYIPDFVVNGGGVCGWIQSRDDIFSEHFKKMVNRAIAVSNKKGQTVRFLCEKIANEKYIQSIDNAYRNITMKEKLKNKVMGMPILSQKISKLNHIKKVKKMCERIDSYFL